jgi:RNA polymerase sigma-70 factor (family 1)
MDNNLDHSLVSSFNKNHPDAFASVFNSYYESLCRFAQQYVHDHNDSEDVVQDVFTRLWANDFVVNANSNIKSFLYTAVKNSCIDFLRKRKTEASRNQILEYKSQQDEYFFGQVWRAEVLQEIVAEIDMLPDQCRTIFQKLYFEDLSPKDVASQLSISEATVRSQKRHAISLLKRKLFPGSIFTVAAVAATAAAVFTVLGLLLYCLIAP